MCFTRAVQRLPNVSQIHRTIIIPVVAIAHTERTVLHENWHFALAISDATGTRDLGLDSGDRNEDIFGYDRGRLVIQLLPVQQGPDRRETRQVGFEGTDQEQIVDLEKERQYRQ